MGLFGKFLGLMSRPDLDIFAYSRLLGAHRGHQMTYKGVVLAKKTVCSVAQGQRCLDTSIDRMQRHLRLPVRCSLQYRSEAKVRWDTG